VRSSLGPPDVVAKSDTSFGFISGLVRAYGHSGRNTCQIDT